MLNNKEVERQYRTIALLSVSGWLFVIFIAIVGILVAIFSPKPDPIDDKAIKSREIIRHLFVTDSTNNGFRLCYATIKEVTPERYQLMLGDQAMRDSFKRLETLAPIVFGDLLSTDIHDFGGFAKQFDPPGIMIHNIFVFGRERQKLYVGENPRIKNWAKWINSGTAQGLLYLRSEDIYYHSPNRRKVYRYFKCSGVNQMSDTDEHFSHFSEEERIW